jgi:hypothetical protein
MGERSLKTLAKPDQPLIRLLLDTRHLGLCFVVLPDTGQPPCRPGKE